MIFNTIAPRTFACSDIGVSGVWNYIWGMNDWVTGWLVWKEWGQKGNLREIVEEWWDALIMIFYWDCVCKVIAKRDCLKGSIVEIDLVLLRMMIVIHLTIHLTVCILQIDARTYYKFDNEIVKLGLDDMKIELTENFGGRRSIWWICTPIVMCPCSHRCTVNGMQHTTCESLVSILQYVFYIRVIHTCDIHIYDIPRGFNILSRATLVATSPPFCNAIAPIIAYSEVASTSSRPDFSRLSFCKGN